MYYTCIIIANFYLISSAIVTKNQQDASAIISTNKEIDLNKHLQSVYIGKNTGLHTDRSTYDEINDDGISCARDCTKYSENRICYYKLVAEQYHVMGPACGECPRNERDCFNQQCIVGDGIERTVLTFNRMIPGPAIHVCYKDRIIVDVLNKMPGRALTVHWHGMLQEKSPWMDGVPYITQCPIHEGQSYRYDFIASTKQTHFYHSHEGFQIFDGLSGSLIVRTHKNLDPQSHLYDYDLFSHTIFIQDWTHLMSDNRFPGYHQNIDLRGLKADTYLINGMGSFTKITLKKSTETPYAVFNVQHSKRYRFRIIAATSLTCSLKFTVQNHAILLIAIDGNPVEAVQIRTMTITSGDVFDVVIEANNKPSAYWIFIKGIDECELAVQGAVLKYEESTINTPNTPYDSALFTELDYPDFNDVRSGCTNPTEMLCMEHLNSLVELPTSLFKPEPDVKLFLEAQAYKFKIEELYQTNSYYKHYIPVGNLKNGMFLDMFNNFSFVLPPFPILTQNDPILEKLICPQECPPKQLCQCLHLIKVNLGSVVEITLTDEISNDRVKFEHPQHIHGHHLIIIKQGNKKEREYNTWEYGKHMPNKPVVRSTVNVPAGGFAIMRFEAINPGFWLFHCHFTFHSHNGMAVLFQVGERHQFLDIPKDLPKCGDYVLPVQNN